MRRVAATVDADVRVQLRNGFYLATAFVVICSVLFLRWLPDTIAELLLPIMLLENVLINTFYFVSALLLLERLEGTFTAQCVTPLRTAEYLTSKVLTLTALSVMECLLIAIVVEGFEIRVAWMILGVVLAATLFCLSGVALVARYGSINEFILPSVLYSGLLSLPILGFLGVGVRGWYLPHPIQGPLELIQGRLPIAPGGLAYAAGYPLLWIAPAFLLARSALRRLRGQ